MSNSTTELPDPVTLRGTYFVTPPYGNKPRLGIGGVVQPIAPLVVSRRGLNGRLSSHARPFPNVFGITCNQPTLQGSQQFQDVAVGCQRLQQTVPQDKITCRTVGCG